MFDASPRLSDSSKQGNACDFRRTPLDGDALSELLTNLSAEDLEALEDDLDFAHFSGALTPRIAAMIESLGASSARNAA